MNPRKKGPRSRALSRKLRDAQHCCITLRSSRATGGIGGELDHRCRRGGRRLPRTVFADVDGLLSLLQKIQCGGINSTLLSSSRLRGRSFLRGTGGRAADKRARDERTHDGRKSRVNQQGSSQGLMLSGWRMIAQDKMPHSVLASLASAFPLVKTEGPGFRRTLPRSMIDYRPTVFTGTGCCCCTRPLNLRQKETGPRCTMRGPVVQPRLPVGVTTVSSP